MDFFGGRLNEQFGALELSFVFDFFCRGVCFLRRLRSRFHVLHYELIPILKRIDAKFLRIVIRNRILLFLARIYLLICLVKVEILADVLQSILERVEVFFFNKVLLNFAIAFPGGLRLACRLVIVQIT